MHITEASLNTARKLRKSRCERPRGCSIIQPNGDGITQQATITKMQVRFDQIFSISTNKLCILSLLFTCRYFIGQINAVKRLTVSEMTPPIIVKYTHQLIHLLSVAQTCKDVIFSLSELLNVEPLHAEERSQGNILWRASAVAASE